MSSLEADFLAENDYDFLNNSQYSIENYRMVKSREQQLRNEMSRQSKESRQRSRITNRNPQNRSESKQSTAVIQREPTQTQIFRNCDFTDGNQQNYYEPKLPIKKEIIKGQTFQNSNTSAANKAEETKKFEESKIENSISISSNKSLTDYFITKVNKIRRSRTLNEDQIYELELQRKKLLESIFEARQLPTAEALNKKFEDGSGDRKVLRHNRSSTVPSYVANVEPKSPNVGLESNLPIYGDELFKRVIRTSGKNRSNNGSPAVPQTRHLTLPNSNRRLQEPLEGHIRLNDDVLPLARPSTSVSIIFVLKSYLKHEIMNSALK